MSEINTTDNGPKPGKRSLFAIERRAPDPSPQRAKRRYRKDPSVGRDLTTICISIPVALLVELDEFSERAQMNRSHVIRAAVLHMIRRADGSQ